MSFGPENPHKRKGAYVPGRFKRPRITGTHPLPYGVKREPNHYGNMRHWYLQHDGQWHECSNRLICRECGREDAMKGTMQRLREALEEHFGATHIRTIPDGEDLFADAPDSRDYRTLGDASDRNEMLICIGLEFGIFLPEVAAVGPVTLEGLADLVDVLIATRDASPH